MNLPNRITIGRLVSVPFFAAALLIYRSAGGSLYYGAALAVFTLAVISDGLDGYLARSRNQQTRLGSLLDPLADKLLLDTSLVILALGVRNLYRVPAWFVLIVVVRDLILFGLALRCYPRWARGEVRIRPNIWGKTSAVTVMILVIWILLHPSGPPPVVTGIALYLATILTVVAGALYLAEILRSAPRK